MSAGRMSLLDFFAQAPQAFGRFRKGLDDAAERQRRTKAKQEALIEPFPETLRPTPEERAINQADIARQLNEQAARDEMAADRAAVNRELARPFPSVNPNPKPQGVMDMENAIYGSMYESQTPPPPPPPKEISEEQRKFRESFALDTAPVTPEQPTTEELRAAPLNEEGQRLQGLLQSMGAFDQTGKAGGANQSVAAQEPGFLSRLGRGVLDYYSDPVNRKTLAIGLAGLSSQPNRGYQAALQGQVEQIQEQRALQRSGNQTADYLESRGLVAEADLVRANPALAADILSGSVGGSNYQKELEKIVAQDDRDLVNEATKQRANREKTLGTLQTIDNDEAFLGALSPIQTSVGRVLQSLGVEATDEGALGEFLQKSSNTELLRAQLGRTVFEAIGELGIGARGLDTPAERKFLIEVMAGTPESTRAFLRGLLQDRLRSQEITIEEYNKALKEGRLNRFQQYAKRGLSPIELEPYGDEFAEFEIVN